MRAGAATVWEDVHAERRRLLDDLTGVSDAAWRTPSLCPGWDVHDVVAHLVDTARTGRVSFVRDLLAAHMDFDRANARGIARHKRDDPRATLGALRDAVDLTRTPPVNLATRLVEAVVHGEDVRRPLGIPGAYPARAVTQALAYQLRTPVTFGGGRERAAGLRLVDRSTGESWGTGEGVAADAVDLLLAVSGRPVPQERFDGPGAPRLVLAAQPVPTTQQEGDR
ncbi:maleylpyruvate isomerase family mycothiol-dependent enzyme [Sanguibacter suaedae]|uniref:Maleylpyruvate isomerase family mycothiol-dependent enzyme n=1 Tax=Sanguibacter suaedae TaxID=2795737 RepID=A0A934I0S4_9MICO|nr:maleylpyruvate isomerase family mycothiol-dependent enzyme [Sanguibacter suaedae]MBI9113464.1 maleylpyruvate isomerase family mycothiol-dependent enzyme [Sanguibacter suaedae]